MGTWVGLGNGVGNGGERQGSPMLVGYDVGTEWHYDRANGVGNVSG